MKDHRYFQWLVGERKGEIVLFDSVVQEDNMIFITFKDGSRINEDLVLNLNERDVTNRVMAEIENPSKCWTFKQIDSGVSKPRVEQDWESQVKYEVPSVEEIAHADLTGNQGVTKPVPRKKRIELIPPPYTRPEIVQSRFATIVNAPVEKSKEVVSTNNNESVNSESPVKSTVNSNDPVYIMMDKSKKVDTEVNMTLTISLPSSHLFDVVRDSFEEGDTKALEYIIENIDISEIKTALKNGIKEMYGSNKNPEDNKISVGDGTDHGAYPMSVGELFEPEVIEEPVVKDIDQEKAENIQKDLDERLAEAHEKANEVNVLKD